VITPLSPRHPDDNEDRVDDDDYPEANNEDGSEINSFFPFTLAFWVCQLWTDLPLPLFLRQEYDHISALIKKEERFGDSQWSTWNW